MSRKRMIIRVAAFLSVGVAYRLLLVALGAISFRKGHWFLGLVGIIFPALWVVGAILPRKGQQERS